MSFVTIPDEALETPEALDRWMRETELQILGRRVVQSARLLRAAMVRRTRPRENMTQAPMEAVYTRALTMASLGEETIGRLLDRHDRLIGEYRAAVVELAAEVAR